MNPGNPSLFVTIEIPFLSCFTTFTSITEPSIISTTPSQGSFVICLRLHFILYFPSRSFIEIIFASIFLFSRSEAFKSPAHDNSFSGIEHLMLLPSQITHSTLSVIRFTITVTFSPSLYDKDCNCFIPRLNLPYSSYFKITTLTFCP